MLAGIGTGMQRCIILPPASSCHKICHHMAAMSQTRLEQLLASLSGQSNERAGTYSRSQGWQEVEGGEERESLPLAQLAAHRRSLVSTCSIRQVPKFLVRIGWAAGGWRAVI